MPDPTNTNVHRVERVDGSPVGGRSRLLEAYVTREQLDVSLALRHLARLAHFSDQPVVPVVASRGYHSYARSLFGTGGP